MAMAMKARPPLPHRKSLILPVAQQAHQNLQSPITTVERLAHLAQCLQADVEAIAGGTRQCPRVHAAVVSVDDPGSHHDVHCLDVDLLQAPLASIEDQEPRDLGRRVRACGCGV